MEVNIFDIISLLVVLAALFAFVNHKFLKLPETIGLLLIALVTSLLILGLNELSPGLFASACRVVEQVNFSEVLMNGMLSFLLFAGALHIKSTDLTRQIRPILLFATLGVVLCTIIIGLLFYFLVGAVGYAIPLVYCLLFGALISPTDPVAVLSILKETRVSKDLETKIAGESLFNDGIGVVVYLSLLLAVDMGLGELTFGEVATLFAEEAVGGVLYGAALGIVGVRLMKLNDDPKLEVMLTIAIAMGGYGLATFIHVSGPLAMVVTGLIVGNNLRKVSTEEERRYVDIFWETIDELLNAILFILIGLEILTLNFQSDYIFIGAVSYLIVLLGRVLSLAASLMLTNRDMIGFRKSISILTWSGLRGGISIALALSLPEFVHKDLIVVTTYIVVVLSILIQGLSIKRVVKNLKLNIPQATT